jgi:hypothetical protein
VRVARQRLDVRVRVFAHPGGEFRIHLGDALRGTPETGALRVFADAFEYEPDARFRRPVVQP